ncbi:MAG: DNA recombination protein RmuC [Defluviitaleaceae bacterium]|nr:DNA recombination protein RmuC [Defluviitaleaceae bacterium]
MEIILLIIILGLVAAGVVFQITSQAKQARNIESALNQAARDMLNQISHGLQTSRAEQETSLDRLRESLTQRLDNLRESQHKGLAALSQDTQTAMANLARDTQRAMASLASDTQKAIAVQTKDMQETQTNQAKIMQENLHLFQRHLGESTEKIRLSVDEKLIQLQGSNERKLDEMRQVVNEKLEKTLETRLQQSFANVSTQLESVNKGLGEMKTVAQSVGSLSRILSGTKSRGILGEVQLGQIIEDMLPPQLYDKEVPTFKSSTNRVEYAVKLPGLEEGHHVYLPVDSKFPLESYERLLDSYEAGDSDLVEAARKALQSRIKLFAKDVKNKYVSPPETTHFAVVFLPTEGLYAEAVRDAAFFDGLRQDGIILTGPTTFSAMLNSLQMGFKTLQIQKSAADIEKVLGAVKKEFGNFEEILTKAHKRITEAGTEIDKLVGVRARAINRSLRDVQTYTGGDGPLMLGITEEE